MSGKICQEDHHDADSQWAHSQPNAPNRQLKSRTIVLDLLLYVFRHLLRQKCIITNFISWRHAVDLSRELIGISVESTLCALACVSCNFSLLSK